MTKLPLLTPNSSLRRKYEATLALWMMFLLGRHAMFGRDPNVLPFNDDNALSFFCQRPGKKLRSLSAPQDDEIVLFRFCLLDCVHKRSFVVVGIERANNCLIARETGLRGLEAIVADISDDGNTNAGHANDQLLSQSLQMDWLSPFFAHFSLSARVFYSGQLCGVSGDHVTAAAGHLHVVRSGALKILQRDGPSKVV